MTAQFRLCGKHHHQYAVDGVCPFCEAERWRDEENKGSANPEQHSAQAEHDDSNVG